MNILKVAFSQLGIKEISGDEDNPQIVKYAEETGIGGINNDEIAWCSTFVNWCAKESDLPLSKKANARSWLNVGQKVTSPKPGDIVVFWRESIHSWKGHVGIFLGFNGNANKLYCLGGNQSNAVTIATYDTGKVLGYRRLVEVKETTVPEPTLKKGNKGQRVIQLQLLLNQLGYNCGDVDGDFGTKTENALKTLQANNQLTIDGEYGLQSKNCIESLLQS